MQQVLKQIFNKETLNRATAYQALKYMSEGGYNETELAGFLSAFVMRQPTMDELAGFRDALLEECIPVNTGGIDAIDIVGTGGDGKNSFNISTLAAIVTAAAGFPVIKHGNYGASSVSGASNVLEYLGYRFPDHEAAVCRQLELNSISFLHAPLFHPAMKRFASVRKGLGVRTFFNLLGPLINPARPSKQLLGVSHLAAARMYHYLLQEMEQQYIIVHSLDGYDEISLTAPFKMLTNTTVRIIAPEAIGFERIEEQALAAGSTVADAAGVFTQVLQGTATPAQMQVVIANSGMAIHCMNPTLNLQECFALAEEALVSGKARQVFSNMLNLK